ncbi:MAG TPA: GNAT family N-acetyltransferase [Acidimicrobiales bacterium]|nr:GNAT family N-acetyltransferase [Acidimicrobiales bacterium]
MSAEAGPAADPVGLVEAGLVAAWARQVSWIPGATFHRVGGVVVVLTGLADQTQQVALAERDPDDPEAAVAAAEVLVRRAGWRPAFDLAAGAHPRLEAALGAAGFEVVGSRPAMVAPTRARVLGPSRAVHAASVTPPGLVIRAARPGDLPALVALQSTAFTMAPRVAQGLVAEGIWRVRGVRVLVAELDGRVVGSAFVHLDRPAAGLVGVGVDAGVRRRGVGRALTEASLRAAASAGIEQMWLQSTPMGEALYRSLGFRAVAEFRVWLAS